MITMEILPDTYQEDQGFLFCDGRITIGNFSELFTVALNCWTIEDYKRQWKTGIEKIYPTHGLKSVIAGAPQALNTDRSCLKRLGFSGEKITSNNNSCLVASVQHPQNTPQLVDWWILYKIENKIIIQNHLLTGKWYSMTIGTNLFSPESCYQFIQPRLINSSSDELHYSEWEVDVESCLTI